MNKGLIIALCLGLLPGPQLKADIASETTERQLRRASPAFEERRRSAKRAPRRPRITRDIDTTTQTSDLEGGTRLGSKDHAGSKLNTSSVGDPKAGSGETGEETNGAGSTSNVNSTSSPNFAGNFGKALSRDWSDFLRSVSHSSNGPLPTSSNGHPRPHYSTPEPGIFLELAVLLAGLGLNAIRRRQPKG